MARDDDALELLRAWWQRTTGKTDDERPMTKQPLAMVMLRFYRYAVQRLRELEEKPGKDSSDLQDMDRLTKILEVGVPEKTFLARIEDAWKGTLTTSGDPIWDDWVARVKSGNIPDEWLGKHDVQKG